MSYIAENGTVITDEMVDRWAAEAEAGFPNCDVEVFAGHPEETHSRVAMTPRTTRASDVLWGLVEAEARRSGQTTSAWARQALAEAVAHVRA